MAENRKCVTDNLKKYRHIWLLVFACGVLLFAGSKAGERLDAVFSGRDTGNAPVVVIDAGHGGADPGKVGKTGVAEKEINLAIAIKLKERLQENGIQAVLTRESDEGLYSADATNKKREDMEARVRIITEAEPVLAVSVHQNSYPEENCKGAQVFYYTGSEQSRHLAEILQKKFPEMLQDGNNRQAKENKDYYLLRKTACPIVIAECGFLSNPSEEALLISGDYQDKVADVLCAGILQYISETTEK